MPTKPSDAVESLTKIFEKPRNPNYIQIDTIRKISFTGDFSFGKPIKDSDRNYKEMRIEGYGSFDRLMTQQKQYDHPIEFYLRCRSKYEDSWSAWQHSDNSMISLTLPEEIFNVLYRQIIRKNREKLVIVVSVDPKTVEKEDGMVTYPCHFEALEITPTSENNIERLFKHYADKMTKSLRSVLLAFAFPLFIWIIVYFIWQMFRR